MTANSVIVIGAGMGGLTAAAYLARAGLEVQVFEQHTLPGGYVSSFIREGFNFPAGPTSFGSNGIVFPILKELGLDGKRRFLPAGSQLSWDEQDVPLVDAAQVCEALSARFPSEADGLKRYFRWVEVGAKGFRDLMGSGILFGRNTFLGPLRNVLRHPLIPWAMAAARGQTNRSLHARYFKNDLLRQMLNQLGYPVMTGQNTLGMWGSYFYDSWVPEGGMLALANAFTRAIREHGGQVHLGRRVRRIRVQDGAATGVELSGGDFVPAQAVVTAADLHHTFFDLLRREHLSPGLLAKLERAAPSESVFAVYLGVAGHPELASGLQRFQRSHVWFTCADGAYLQIVLLSKDDPSLAPAGKHALYLAMLSPYEEWEPLKADREAYCARKQVKMDEIIRRAEEFIPNLMKHIVVGEAASPLTFERYTSNWRGSTAGWSWDPQRRIRIDFAKDLALKNFYAAGHYTFAPGGVPTAMITAWYTAKEVLENAGKGSRR